MPGTFQYDAPSNTITVTGGTEVAPADFASMYAADQAGGWGVVLDKLGGIYKLNCKVKVGDGSTSTYFGDASKVIEIDGNAITASYSKMFEIMNNATLRFGELIDAPTYRTKNGCTFHCHVPYAYVEWFLTRGASGGSNIYHYGSRVRNIGGFAFYLLYAYGTRRCWNCYLDGTIYAGHPSSLYNLYSSNNGSRCLQASPDPCERIMLHNVHHLFMCDSGGDKWAKNVVAVGNTYCSELYNSSRTIWLADCDMETWTPVFNGTLKTGQMFRQYGLNLHITDADDNNLQGATVSLKDKDDNEIVPALQNQTAADGTITFDGEDSSPYDNMVTHTRMYYDGGNQYDYRGPWILTISKDGYRDYQDTIVIDRKMDLEIALSTGGTIILRRFYRR